MPLHLIQASRRSGTVIVRSSYDYVPTVMLDGNYRMWWGGGVAGDFILYAESSGLGGPWSNPQSVFQPTFVEGTFDQAHTCDPSVIHVDGTYYMYYGGNQQQSFPTPTQLGVATSRDGIAWERLNGGHPIIKPHGDINRLPEHLRYGAGQPSIIFLDGKFYLIYTDSTGLATNSETGGGQYVLRSPDPTFCTGVEELTAQGFKARGTAANVTTEYSLLDAVSVDWQFIDILDAFLIVTHGILNQTNLTFFNKSLSNVFHTNAITNSQWTEGPGIVCRPDRHAVPSRDNAARVPIDVVRSVGNQTDVNTWDLGYVGMDLETGLAPDAIPYARLYEGSGIQCAGYPLTLVVGGVRLQFESAAPFVRLARNVFDVSDTVYHWVPPGASLPFQARVLGVQDRPPAFLLDDDRLWPTDCLEVITENGSSIDFSQPDEYYQREQSGKVGPALHCIH